MKRLTLVVVLAACAVAFPAAQHYQADFPPAEFRARWSGVFDRIGSQALAVVQGVPTTNGYQLPRQHNTFYYLSGIETPGSYLVLDGRTRQVTMYLPARNAALEAAEGKVLSADDADLVKTLTGADDVRPTSAMVEGNWPVGGSGGRGAGSRVQAIYAEFEPPEGYAQSRGELRAGDRSILNDPLDGRLFMVPTDSGPPRSLVDSGGTRPPSVQFPTFSSDGREVLFGGFDANGAGIWAVPFPAGGKPQLVLRYDDPLRVAFGPYWTLSRDRLFVVLAEAQSDIWVLETDGL